MPAASSTAALVLGIIVLVLASIGPSAGAHAQSGWVLWERKIDPEGKPLQAWQRREVFEAQRWCKGAMTIAINKALTPKPKGESGDDEPKVEYQCRPEGEGAPASKAPR